MQKTYLFISGLHFSYPGETWRLEVPEFRLSTGEMASLVGPNGSGKSTCLRLCAGVLPYRVGRIELNGDDIRTMPRRQIARILGYLPQETFSEFDYTVTEIVTLGRYPHLTSGGFLSEKDRKVVQESMQLTETSLFAERRISRLSGGERRRVFLASVLAQEPQILLLDEPTGALDLHHQIQLFTLLTNLTTRGIAVLVVTHDLNLASHFCKRMILMNNGSMIRDGNPMEVLSSEILMPIYGQDILVSRHPQTGNPVVFPAKKGKGS